MPSELPALEQAQLTDDVKDYVLKWLADRSYGATLEAVTGSYDDPTDVLDISIDFSEVRDETDPAPSTPAERGIVLDVPDLFGGYWGAVSGNIQESIERAAMDIQRYMFIGDVDDPTIPTPVQAVITIPTGDKAAILALTEISDHIANQYVQVDSGGFPVKLWGYPVEFNSKNQARMYYPDSATGTAIVLFDKYLSTTTPITDITTEIP